MNAKTAIEAQLAEKRAQRDRLHHLFYRLATHAPELVPEGLSPATRIALHRALLRARNRIGDQKTQVDLWLMCNEHIVPAWYSVSTNAINISSSSATMLYWSATSNTGRWQGGY